MRAFLFLKTRCGAPITHSPKTTRPLMDTFRPPSLTTPIYIDFPIEIYPTCLPFLTPCTPRLQAVLAHPCFTPPSLTPYCQEQPPLFFPFHHQPLLVVSFLPFGESFSLGASRLLGEYSSREQSPSSFTATLSFF